MKIKSVIIEGFHNVVKKEYKFEDINYLHGKNGVGKSTVLQAIQLGLLGYVPGSNKTKQGIFAHSNNHTMAVKVVMDDNGQEVSIQRTWIQSKGSVTESTEVLPATYDIKALVADIELPLFNFDEFTHMTANTLKDWFINYLPKQSFKTDWEKQLCQSVSTLPESMVDASLIDASCDAIKELGLEGVEEIRAANTYFKNQLSFMKSELARKTGTIQSLIHYDDYSSEYTEDELKSLIASTENAIVRQSRIEQIISREEALKKELESLKYPKSMLEQLKMNYDQQVKDRDEIADQQNEKELRYRELMMESKNYQNIIDSEGVCIFTQETCDKIKGLRDKYILRKGELILKMSTLEEELEELQKRKVVLDGLIHNKYQQISALQYDAKRAAQIQEELANIPEVDCDNVNVEVLQSRLEEYKDMYGKAVANRQYNELHDLIVGDKYRIENTIECLKLWVKLTDVNGLQASGGDSNPFEGLTNSINKVLQKLFKDNVNMMFNSEGKANSFSFGIQRDKIYVPYNLLSSGEKCMFILSMFIGLLEYTATPLRLILIDDFLDHLDDDNFKSIFEVLNDSNIQYIFAGVKPIDSAKCNLIEIGE